MQAHPIQTVVIVGGGTAGWMTATALATVLRGRCRIRLVESEEIGIVGVGEATIPMIARFNQVAGIDENAMLKATHGTFKLGIEFVNWGRLGERYMHGFGAIGQDMGTQRFVQYWLKMRRLGKAGPLDQYAITRAAAYANKFMPARLDLPNSPLSSITHAYHFDASLYARHLRTLAEERGVLRTEGKVRQVTRREPDGHVDAVVLENGTRIEGDLFIDCSGFRALLIEGALQTGFEDWSAWLPCDRALAVPCAAVERLTPYTRATAHSAGWQWRIPLQHRTGNGHVYCSAFISDDEAQATLLANLDGEALAEPRMVKFSTGMRKRSWNKNVVAIGLSSGFLEPLESTSIHLIQSAIARLIEFFPDGGWNATEIAEFNRQSRFEYERIRDFIILHYKLNQRDDSDFWKQCASMSVPATLQDKIDLFKAHGKVVRTDNELFAEVGWVQVMLGQNLEPEHYHPLVDAASEAEVAGLVEGVGEVVKACVNAMPEHGAYIRRFCDSGGA
ncbi:MAG: tryptophan halogenase family protein [Gammaproteobacteria bacterium]